MKQEKQRQHRILIVDDTPSMLNLLNVILKEAGYYVLMATDGEKAANRAKLIEPDLILLDIVMPGIDGYDTCRRLKAEKSTKDIPVIFLSGLHETFDKIKGFKAGAVDFVSKPIEAEELLSRVQVHLKIHDLQQELSEVNASLEEKVLARTKELSVANEALQESEEAFRSLVENSQDYIMRYDKQCRHLYENPAALRVSGFTTDEIIGRTHRELGFDEDLCEFWEEKITSVFETGESSAEMFTWESVDGPVTLDWRLFPEFDQGEGIKSVLGVSRDITKLKQAEEQLQHYSQHLEELVEERTRELQEAHEELRRKEKLSILGQLAGGVAHELRNPLGAINNIAYLLNMLLKESDQEVAESLEILQQEVRTASGIINSLLDFAGPQESIPRHVNITQLLQAVLTRQPIPEPITVDTNFNKAFPQILADPEQLEIVFGNLIRNAVQAMPEGGRLSVEVSETCGQSSKEKWVVVSIADTGVGIPGDHMDKLFEPLFTTKAKGIGLGLALVKMLVEGQNGKITVRSEPGKGSSFRLCLPIVSNAASMTS